MTIKLVRIKIKFWILNTIRYPPKNQYTNTNNDVSQQRTDGHHVDKLFEIEYARQYAWKRRERR